LSTTTLDARTKRVLQDKLRQFYERELTDGQRAYFNVRDGELIPTRMGQHWLAEHQQVFAELLQLSPTDTFLDVGCGEGYYTMPLAKTTRFSVGADVSSSVLQLMQSLRVYDAKQLGPCLMDVEKLPFASQTFDKALCSHLLEHVLDDCAVVGEIQRVMKPNGIAVFAIPLKYTTPYQAIRAVESLGRKIFRPGKQPSPVAAPGELEVRLVGRQAHIRHYSVSVFIQMLDEMGFTAKRVLGMWFHDPRRWLVYHTQPRAFWYNLGTQIAKRDPNFGAGLVVQTIRR
jgi:2-polyprenyl-3-methyl-5-hydroxy-6-metoxy-1,4-benzoquinol methylase